MSTTELNTASVEAGKLATQRDLAAAKLELEEASFAAAQEGTKAAREALASARSRYTALQDELEALEMVGREAARRERVAARQVEVDALRALEVEAIAAVDHVPKAFDRMRKAVIELTAAWGALKDATAAARVATIRCNAEAITGSQLLVMPQVVRELMLHHAGNELDTSVGALSRDADYFDSAVSAVVGQSRAFISAGVAAKLEAAQEVPAAAYEPEPIELRRAPARAVPGQPGAIYAVE